MQRSKVLTNNENGFHLALGMEEVCYEPMGGIELQDVISHMQCLCLEGIFLLVQPD